MEEIAKIAQEERNMAAKIQPFTTRQHMIKRTFEIYRYRDFYLNEVALHHHDFYEVYLFLSGNVNYTIESRNYYLSPGDILLISPMELHQPTFGSDNRNYERFVLWIDKGYMQQFIQSGQDLAGCFDNTVPWHTSILRPDNTSWQLLSYLLEQLMHESESKEFASDLYAQTYLVQALILLNRLAEHSPKQSELRDKSDSVVSDVLSYINDHYGDDLSLDLLANKFFISKYHLSREFNRLVGTSVYRYIIQKRLAIAKLLMSQGTPSTTVYQQCGFGDYSNFYRAFKSEYQISPKEFIAQLKEDAARAEEMNKERNWFHRDNGES